MSETLRLGQVNFLLSSDCLQGGSHGPPLNVLRAVENTAQKYCGFAAAAQIHSMLDKGIIVEDGELKKIREEMVGKLNECAERWLESTETINNLERLRLDYGFVLKDIREQTPLLVTVSSVLHMNIEDYKFVKVFYMLRKKKDGIEEGTTNETFFSRG